MATRSSGRSDERPNARTTSSSASGTTRRQGSAPSGASAAAQSGGSGSSATPNSQPNQTTRDKSGNQPSQSQRTAAGSAVAGGSTTRGDQERELRTSREQGNMRPSSSAQRANVGQESDYSTPLVAWSGSSPFAMMRRMMDDMDRLFSDFGFTYPGLLASSLLSPEIWTSSQTAQRSVGGGSSAGSSISPSQRGQQQGLQRGGQQGLQQSSFRSLWSPQVEVFERGNNLVIRADLPGLTRDDVDVELDNDALIIRGERSNDVEDERDGYYRSERSYGSFYRAIPLPENIDVNTCNATFKDGVLEVTLPKPPQQASRGRKIDVR